MFITMGKYTTKTLLDIFNGRKISVLFSYKNYMEVLWMINGNIHSFASLLI